VNVYQPNSQRGLTRLDHRVGKWDPAFLRYLSRLQAGGKPAIFCGDLNVAHEEIDLTNTRGRTLRNRPASRTRRGRASGGSSGAAVRGHVPRVLKRGPGATTPGEPDGRLQGPDTSGGGSTISWRLSRLRPRSAAWISPEVMGSDQLPGGLELP